MVKYGSSSISKKKQNDPTQFVLNPYEKVRTSNMEKNAQRFKELGLDQLAQQLLERLNAHTKGKKNDNNADDDNQDCQHVDRDDQDYQPEDNDGYGSDEENSNVSKKAAIGSSSKSLPNKKVRTREYAPRLAKKQPLCPALAMDKFLEIQ